jgi:hypothetical protein
VILYFDNFIVDSPMSGPGYYRGLEAIRQTDTSYRDQNRLAISLYTLASYAMLEWDGVLIRYECADPAQDETFEQFARGLFPAATIIRERSDSQKKFQASLEILESMPGDWVFVAANNDHPIVASDLSAFARCVETADAFAAQHAYVSVLYSHLVELRSSMDGHYPIAWYDGRNWSRLAETADYIVARAKHGFPCGIQIMHKRMLRQLISGKDYRDQHVRRTDDMDAGLIPGHVMVASKHAMADHYDGYAHKPMPYRFLPYETYPPLFIPAGFFESEIRIAYGFETTRKGWVNVNPAAESYSFQDPIRGTDLKLSLERLPAFWKARIKEIDVNPKADRAELESKAIAVQTRMDYPWPRVSAIAGMSLLAYHRVSTFTYQFGSRYLRFLRPLYRRLRSS